MRPANSVFANLGTTVFETMTRLANDHGAVNLGQGFPDDAGPAEVLDRAAEAIRTGWNQYPPMLGLPELRQAVADHADRFYGVSVDWRTETMVTSGATEALAACLLALLEPGDEVVCFEPMYDAYVPMIRRAGGVPRFVTLSAPDWSFTAADLAAAFGPKTKAVLLNDPLNPAAKCFTAAELALIAEACLAHDAVVIADEVYEHIVFDGRRHETLLAYPGMRDRVAKIGSAGKTFSLTGWKVGYITAAPDLLAAIAKAHQFLVFTTPPNLQSAVAFGLAKGADYFDGLAAEMQRRRDRLSAGLTAAGLKVLPAAGTYFVNVDLAGTDWEGRDEAYCRHITTEKGVAAIPLSAFYPNDPKTDTVRFCFAKQDAVLDKASALLAA